MKDRERPFTISNAMPRAYVVVSMGMAHVKLFPHILKQAPYGRLDFYLFKPVGETCYYSLYEDSPSIERELGTTLEWNDLSDKNTGVIRRNCSLNISLEDQKRWPELYEWYDIQLQAFYNIFKPRLQRLLEQED